MRLNCALAAGALCALLILSGCRPAPGWHWERAEAGLPRQAVVLALAVDPSDPTRLWAGYYAPGGLATSHDGGKTWTIGAEGLGDNPVFDLLPFPDSHLWAATRDGLLESVDGGASWKPAAGDLPPATVFALAADASGRLYAGLDGAGLYAREPGEGRWVSLTNDEPLTTAAVLSLAVSSDGTQLYAGTAGRGLFSSHDAGHTWTAAFPGDYVPNMALNLSHPTTAVASLRDRLVRTRDGGESWDVLPVPWARDEVVSLLWPADDVLWAGSGQGQVYRSQDEGDTWVMVGNGVPTQGGVLALATTGDRLLAGTWTGVYATDDDGQSWTYLSPSLGTPDANTLLTADVGLLLGTRTGLFRWQPDVGRWTQVPAQYSQGAKYPQDAQYSQGMEYPQGAQYSQGRDFPSGGVTALAVAPSDRRVVYAGAAASGLYRSDDGGASWARVPSDLEVGIRALAVDPENADHVYILAAWERMYESTDAGQSWQARWAGLDVTTEAISLALDPLHPATLYLGADTGLYRSRYGGEDWRPVGRPLDEQTVLTLQVRRSAERLRRSPQDEVAATRPALGADEESSVLYIGATRGAYRSYDGGDTVEPWGHGLEGASVTAFLFDPNDSRKVYAATAYAGLCQSLDAGEIWQPIGPPELADEVVEAMAWGPAGELFVASAGGVWVGRD
jgi:photosystem II stability/assembly factor-like uncharacterized protein